RSAEIEPHIDQLVDHTALLGEVPKRLDRLLEVGSRLRVGRARHRLRARLPAVGDGLIPDLAADRVVGQRFHLLAESLAAVEALEGADYPSMEEPPLLVEKSAVDHVVSECMLEGVLDLRQEAGLVDELRGLETPERRVQLVRAGFGNSLQQDEGNVLADDRGRLEKSLILGGKPVDSSSEDGLNRAWHLDLCRCLTQAVATALADDHVSLRQGPDDLFDEERIAFRTLDQDASELVQTGVAAEHGLQEFGGALPSERIDTQ